MAPGVVSELKELFLGRPCRTDGHMVGWIGERLVADAFGLTLMSPFNAGFAAETAEIGCRSAVRVMGWDS